MNRKILLITGAGAVFIAGILAAQQPSPPAEPTRAVLVLRNGEVLQGRISQVDDRFRVDLEAGSLFVSAAEVEMCCTSLEEAYRLKASQVGFNQAHDHARLAQWCQHQGLDQQAEHELQITRRLDPTHPLIGLVERRLAAARTERRPSAPAETRPNSEPSPLQLNEFVAGLPQGTTESFTRVIQPILLNRCATAGCHTSRAENSFKLDRPPTGAPISQRSTQRNLYAVLQLIDRAAPDRSELISPQRCPHRIDTDAMLSLSRSGQYRYLVAWVHALAGNPNGSQPAASAPPATPTGTLTANYLASPQAATPVAAAGVAIPSRNPFGPPPETISTTAATARQPTGEIKSATNPREAVTQPADPFDPEVFNRRFGTSPADPLPAEPMPAAAAAPVPPPVLPQ
ncbi:MAG: hypothetical protein GXY25_22665 [Pirellulaceae bacterium]|jgi:hypothetical protein|nr:hypothetical protein [Thermoguttaceae bacterium]MDI9445519.1 hypothetical protein [Planctomycetota bacterium]NLZ03327.1 hypothetical protein [Pirellulaceae bacterium]